MGVRTFFRQKVEDLKTELRALYFAYQDPRVPLRAKVLIIAVIGYALSPIDLIPDFIPVLGYLDDLIIVPAGVLLAQKMIPEKVLAECREKAKTASISTRAKWVAACIIVCLWLVVIFLVVRLIWQIAF